MSQTSQPSVKGFFSALIPDEYQSELHKLANSNSLFSAPLDPTPLEKKERLNSRKVQNMRDHRSQKKAKNIIQGRRDADGKVVKKKKNAVQILNRTGSSLRSYSLVMALSINHS